jgi:hypothetical protein
VEGPTRAKNKQPQPAKRMRNVIQKAPGIFLIITALVVLSPSLAHAQNPIIFTSATATPENAILLNWQSNTNEIYEIDEADSLLETNDSGTITWNTLYTDYPSQGTNTFIADCGDYDSVPGIVHPSLSPMRFYRVTVTGDATSPTNPTVAVTYPTAGATLSGTLTFTVSSGSPEIMSEVELYIDGEEQRNSSDGSNFVINTCEWLNGQHTIYAIAKSQSAIEGFTFGPPVTHGYATSTFVDVNFNNLITEVSLSQNYFEPTLGETQLVTAIFPQNVNWELQIQGFNSNTVVTATGSGNSLSYNWDGNGQGGTNIPDGAYTYLITAQTNGLPNEQAVTGGGSSGGLSPPTFSMAARGSSDADTQAYTVNDEGTVLPLAIYPPGSDTNGLTIFDATPSDIESLMPRPATRSVSQASFASVGFTSYASSSSSSPSSQSSSSPLRKPRIGVKNSSGTFGICYDTYPSGITVPEPPTGWPYPIIPQTVGLDGAAPASGGHQFSSLTTFKIISDSFSAIMQIGGPMGSYKPVFVKGDNQWGQQDILEPSLGGNSIFNTCNFGMLFTHEIYGTKAEDDNVKYTYFLVPDGSDNWVRLSDLDLGSSGQNGLRWFTTLACDVLNPGNVTSMANNDVLPNNDNLHLLLGSGTINYLAPFIGFDYATNLVAGTSIWPSFQNAAAASYKRAILEGADNMTNVVTFRVLVL